MTSIVFNTFFVASGIPKARWFGVEGYYSISVMDLLEPSVEDPFMFCSRKHLLRLYMCLPSRWYAYSNCLKLFPFKEIVPFVYISSN